MRKTAALPDDFETLKGLVLDRNRALDVAEALCISQTLELEKLRFQIAVLKRERFGRSSEQLDQERIQMRLSIEDLETSLAEGPPEVRPAPKELVEKPARRALPPHLPREEIVHESPCSCPACGGTMRVLGEDVSEMLEYVPQLERIGRLYAIESETRGRPPSERVEVRQARASPELARLHSWLESVLPTLSKKSELATAIRYALSRWTALTRYHDDGRAEIDNNAAERALRCVALGRKNWLFAGSDDGGERAAAIYTLIGTAKLNEINPEAYLRYVLERIAEHPINDIEALLPWNIADSFDKTAKLAA